MIKGEENFIQAIRDVRARGALKVELLCVLEMEYKRNPDPPPPEDVGEGLEDIPIDNKGHVWGMGWEDSDTPHPGFGGSQNIYGGYVDQCEKCGMYGYEFYGSTDRPGKYESQPCGEKIR